MKTNSYLSTFHIKDKTLLHIVAKGVVGEGQ